MRVVGASVLIHVAAGKLDHDEEGLPFGLSAAQRSKRAGTIDPTAKTGPADGACGVRRLCMEISGLRSKFGPLTRGRSPGFS